MCVLAASPYQHTIPYVNLPLGLVCKERGTGSLAMTLISSHV